MKFTELDLNPELLGILQQHGIDTPSEIQERTIPYILDGEDILAESETGSGKTLAFGIPLLECVKPGKGVQVLILCPTRELAKQVAGEFEKFGKWTKLHFLTVYGGVGYEPQLEALPKTDVVIGTPGRVLDLIDRGALITEAIDVVILDEADKMLDMGFIEDIEKILEATPENRQTLLFSATVSYRIEFLSEKYMHHPVLIRAKSQEVRGNLTQGYYVVNPWQKIGLLQHLLSKQDHAIVFCRTKVATDHVADELVKQGVKARALHGNITQAKREQTVKDFTAGKFNVLIATDVAARGLHIDGITHVYNYDLPDDHETYVHRVGRTARQGADGDAVTFLAEDDFRKFDAIMDHYDDEIKELKFRKWHLIKRIPPSPPRQSRERSPRGAPRRGQRKAPGRPRRARRR